MLCQERKGGSGAGNWITCRTDKTNSSSKMGGEKDESEGTNEEFETIRRGNIGFTEDQRLASLKKPSLALEAIRVERQERIRKRGDLILLGGLKDAARRRRRHKTKKKHVSSTKGRTRGRSFVEGEKILLRNYNQRRRDPPQTKYGAISHAAKKLGRINSLKSKKKRGQELEVREGRKL